MIPFDESAVLILAVVFAILLIGVVVFVVRGTIVAARRRISEIIEAEHLQGARSFTDRARKAIENCLHGCAVVPGRRGVVRVVPAYSNITRSAISSKLGRALS